MAERAERRETPPPDRRPLPARSSASRTSASPTTRRSRRPRSPRSAEGSWIDDRESVIFIGDSGHRQDDARDRAGGLRLPPRPPRPLHHARRRSPTNSKKPRRRRELARVVGRYARTELVVLDELGYLALPDGAAELVFQVLSERHERGSLIVTTNLPFGEWTKVFPDPRLAKAVVDRLTHRAHIIDTGTESWRFRHGLTASQADGRPPAE